MSIALVPGPLGPLEHPAILRAVVEKNHFIECCSGLGRNADLMKALFLRVGIETSQAFFNQFETLESLLISGQKVGLSTCKEAATSLVDLAATQEVSLSETEGDLLTNQHGGPTIIKIATNLHEEQSTLRDLLRKARPPTDTERGMDQSRGPPPSAVQYRVAEGLGASADPLPHDVPFTVPIEAGSVPTVDDLARIFHSSKLSHALHHQGRPAPRTECPKPELFNALVNDLCQERAFDKIATYLPDVFSDKAMKRAFPVEDYSEAFFHLLRAAHFLYHGDVNQSPLRTIIKPQLLSHFNQINAISPDGGRTSTGSEPISYLQYREFLIKATTKAGLTRANVAIFYRDQWDLIIRPNLNEGYPLGPQTFITAIDRKDSVSTKKPSPPEKYRIPRKPQKANPKARVSEKFGESDDEGSEMEVSEVEDSDVEVAKPKPRRASSSRKPTKLTTPEVRQAERPPRRISPRLASPAPKYTASIKETYNYIKHGGNPHSVKVCYAYCRAAGCPLFDKCTFSHHPDLVEANKREYQEKFGAVPKPRSPRKDKKKERRPPSDASSEDESEDGSPPPRRKQRR